jgi:hypothetical protein
MVNVSAIVMSRGLCHKCNSSGMETTLDNKDQPICKDCKNEQGAM